MGRGSGPRAAAWGREAFGAPRLEGRSGCGEFGGRQGAAERAGRRSHPPDRIRGACEGRGAER